MNLAAIYKVIVNLKLFCYENDISISYGYLILLFRISVETLSFREQSHPSNFADGIYFVAFLEPKAANLSVLSNENFHLAS